MKKNVYLLIVGSGKMAELLLTSDIPGVIVKSHVTEGFDYPLGKDITPDQLPDDTTLIAVHVGSGRLILGLIDYCTYWKIPLIQASSSLMTTAKGGEPIQLPSEFKFPYIQAPNFALPVLAMFKVLQDLGRMLQKLGIDKVDVMESHQQSKTSAPITAQKIAGFFGGKPEIVKSVRDPFIQEKYIGVPKAHLDAHGYHFIDLESCGVGLGAHTKINGRQPYVLGLTLLLQEICTRGADLKPGPHDAGALLLG